jgi:hypothetical protein
MKKLMALLVLFTLSTTFLLAQTKSKQFKGKVADESGSALPHASVLFMQQHYQDSLQDLL